MPRIGASARVNARAQEIIDNVSANKWLLYSPDHLPEAPLSHGENGIIFLCRGGKFIAKTAFEEHKSGLVRMEGEILRELKGKNGVLQMVQMYPNIGGVGPMLILQRLEGPDLSSWQYFDFSQHAAGMVKSLKTVHKAGYVYKDINPGNFMLHQGQYVLIDFGIAERHPSRNTAFEGSQEFVPLATHQGRPTTPQDDLESLGYLLEWALAGGVLPWTGRSRAEIGRMKQGFQFSPAVAKVIQ